MVTLREHGEYLRLALAMGLLDPLDIIAWADSEIAHLDRPPLELIDIALADRLSRYELFKQLDALPGCADREAAAHRVLGLLQNKLQRGEVTLSDTVKALEAYYNWATVPEAEGLRAYNFDDALFCADQNYYGTRESVRADIDDFLARYASDPGVGLSTGRS